MGDRHRMQKLVVHMESELNNIRVWMNVYKESYQKHGLESSKYKYEKYRKAHTALKKSIKDVNNIFSTLN